MQRSPDRSLPTPALVGAQSPQRVHQAFLVFFSLALFVLERIDQARLYDDARHLSRDGLEESNLIAREFPPPRGLDHEDPERHSIIDQRNSQERMKALLAGLGKIFVARVSLRIDDHDRIHSLDDKSGQPFGDPHGYFS